MSTVPPHLRPDTDLGRLVDMPEPTPPEELAPRLERCMIFGGSYTKFVREIMAAEPTASAGQIREGLTRSAFHRARQWSPNSCSDLLPWEALHGPPQ